MKRKRGRPKTEGPIRDKRVEIYLTEAEADKLQQIAEDLGFRSRSRFIADIMERLIIGGFSPLGFLQVGKLLERHSRKLGVKGKGFYFGFKSLPPFSRADETLTAEEMEPLLDQMQAELKQGKKDQEARD